MIDRLQSKQVTVVSGNGNRQQVADAEPDPRSAGSSGGEQLRGLDIARLLAVADVPDLPLARAYLCEELRAAGISDDILQVMSVVPRHCFVPPHRWQVSYVDQDLWTGSTWLSAPGMVARVLDSLPRGLTRVLEIGTGTGYQSALLATMQREVVTVDVLASCVAEARVRLKALGVTNAVIESGNGLRSGAFDVRFDAVAVNAAVFNTPSPLFGLLMPEGGIVVAPTVLCDGSQRLTRYRVSPTEIVMEDLGSCRFPAIVPL